MAPATTAAPPVLTEHVTFPWWVMALALPILLAVALLAPAHFPAAAGTIHLAVAGSAAFLGLHSPVPEWLKRKPAVAKLIALASGGGVAKLLFFLPLCTEPHLRAYLWTAVALLSWLAGMPLTVGVSGAALPAQLVDPPHGFGDVRALGAMSIGILAGLGGAAWAFGSEGLGLVLLVLAVLSALANGLALLVLGSGERRRSL